MVDGQPITENVAIQTWIARTFPRAQLLPLDLDTEIKALSLMAWFASGIHPALTPIARPTRFCDVPGTEEPCGVLLRRSCSWSTIRSPTICSLGAEFFFDHFTAADTTSSGAFQPRNALFDLVLSDLATAWRISNA